MNDLHKTFAQTGFRIQKILIMNENQELFVNLPNCKFTSESRYLFFRYQILTNLPRQISVYQILS